MPRCVKFAESPKTQQPAQIAEAGTPTTTRDAGTFHKIQASNKKQDNNHNYKRTK